MSKLLCFNFCLVLKKVKLKIATFYKFLFPTTIRNKNPNYNLLKFYFDICSCVCAKLLQLCPTLGNPMNCSPPGSSVCGILQEEYWSRLLFLLQEILLTQVSNLFLLCLLLWQVGSLPLAPPGKPLKICLFTSKNGHENESHFCPCLTPPLQRGHSL